MRYATTREVDAVLTGHQTGTVNALVSLVDILSESGDVSTLADLRSELIRLGGRVKTVEDLESEVFFLRREVERLTAEPELADATKETPWAIGA